MVVPAIRLIAYVIERATKNLRKLLDTGELLKDVDAGGSWATLVLRPQVHARYIA